MKDLVIECPCKGLVSNCIRCEGYGLYFEKALILNKRNTYKFQATENNKSIENSFLLLNSNILPKTIKLIITESTNLDKIKSPFVFQFDLDNKGKLVGESLRLFIDFINSKIELLFVFNKLKNKYFILNIEIDNCSLLFENTKYERSDFKSIMIDVLTFFKKYTKILD